MTQNEAVDFILKRPHNVFAVFTHVDGGFLSADRAIRRVLARVYNIDPDRAFSHCGLVWAEEGKLWYWHQTYPVFIREEFKFRAYNFFLRISDPEVIQIARYEARGMFAKETGYGVGLLLNFALTIWSRITRNTVKIGQVCSSALALMLPGYILPKHTGTRSWDVDPMKAWFALRAKNLPHFTVDRR